MPALNRRHLSTDDRRAVRVAEIATKHELEAFSLDGMDSIYSHKLSSATIKMSSSSPILSNLYQSDEERLSPNPEELDSEFSEYASCESEEEVDELDFDGDDEDVDFSVEEYDDTPRAQITFFSAALAIAVPIRAMKPNIVTFAPMAKRSIPVSRPQSASYATFTRVKAPSPTEVRTSSIYGSSPERPLAHRNFSTPLPRTKALSPPASLTSGTSPASSTHSLGVSVGDEAELLIRESDEIQTRAVLTGTEWDYSIFTSPTPTSWAAYDPFALTIPTLTKTQTYHHEEVEEKPKGWKRLGLKSKLLAAGRKAGRY